MAKIRIQPKDEEIGRRSRTLARNLKGRLFVSHDGLYLVRGKPDIGKLFHCLLSISKTPGFEESQTPLELGFPSQEITALTKEELGVRARALQKWRKIVEDREDLRLRKSKLSKKLEIWKQEIAEIEEYLAECFEVIRLVDESIFNWETPYFLWQKKLHQLNRIKSQLNDTALDEVWRWMGLLVAWIADPEAMGRYLRAVTSIDQQTYLEKKQFCM